MEFSKDNVLLNVNVKDKIELFQYIAQYAREKSIIENELDLVKAFLEREAEVSTGLQDSFAIPHAKSDVIKVPTVVFLKLSNPIDWETFDEKPVSNVFALLVPSKYEGTLHLQMISRIATALLEEDFVNAVKNASDSDALNTQITKTMKGEH